MTHIDSRGQNGTAIFCVAVIVTCFGSGVACCSCWRCHAWASLGRGRVEQRAIALPSPACQDSAATWWQACTRGLRAGTFCGCPRQISYNLRAGFHHHMVVVAASPRRAGISVKLDWKPFPIARAIVCRIAQLRAPTNPARFAGNDLKLARHTHTQTHTSTAFTHKFVSTCVCVSSSALWFQVFSQSAPSCRYTTPHHTTHTHTHTDKYKHKPLYAQTTHKHVHQR